MTRHLWLTPQHAPTAHTRILQGLGVLSGGLLLSVVGLPTGAVAEMQPPPERVDRAIAQIPLPSQRSVAAAQIPSPDGSVQIQLTNDTNAPVSYDVIGEIGRRILAPDETVTLRGIPLPATVTAVRQDEGLLEINPSIGEDNTLDVSLEENSNLDGTQGVIQIQTDGQVYIN